VFGANGLNMLFIHWSVSYKLKRKKGQEKGGTSNLYWFTLPQGLRPVFFTPLVKKVSLNQSIVQLQLITQFSHPARTKNTTELLKLHPAAPINSATTQG